MSRNFISAALAITIGIATGYYTFQPAFQQLQSEKAQSNLSQSVSGPSDATKEAKKPADHSSTVSKPVTEKGGTEKKEQE